MATLSRRQLMVRGAKIGSGVGALLLVGCGESEEPVEAPAAAGVVQAQVQGADEKQSEPDAEAGAAPVEAQAAEQVEVEAAQQQVRAFRRWPSSRWRSRSRSRL